MLGTEQAGDGGNVLRQGKRIGACLAAAFFFGFRQILPKQEVFEQGQELAQRSRFMVDGWQMMQQASAGIRHKDYSFSIIACLLTTSAT
jgi:hypothetical protein